VVNLYVYPTDWDWFAFLRERGALDEVNFWRPGGVRAFDRLQPGELFLFRLGGRRNVIAGGGFFVHFSFAPLLKVWDAFGETNGTPDYPTLIRLISRHKDIPSDETAGAAVVGCIILAAPFFWPEDLWFKVPDSYPVNGPQGFRYDATTGDGKALWDQATARLHAAPDQSQVREWVSANVWGPLALSRRRVGQGTFRMLVSDAYGRRCAVTGERTYPVLEAAHIQSVGRGGIHRLDNGLLLRSDIHTLFDLGYVTVTPDQVFRVGRRLRSEWSNGKVYYDLDERPIHPPSEQHYKPAESFLEWHNKNVYRG
jgi:putative restriction endonuclease